MCVQVCAVEKAETNRKMDYQREIKSQTVYDHVF